MLNKNNKPFHHKVMAFLNSSTFLVLLSVILLGSTVIFWWMEQNRNLDAVAEETNVLVRSYARETETQFDYIYEALSLLADQKEVFYENNIESWKEDADFYAQAFAGVKTIALVDKDYLIYATVPSEVEDELKGQSATILESTPDQINIWVPIYKGTSFQGFVAAVLDIEQLMTPVVEEINGSYELQVVMENVSAFETLSPFAPDERFAASESMVFQDEAVLLLTLSPTQTTVRSAIRAARNSFVVSLLGTAFTIGAVFVAQNFNKLAITNQQRYQNLFDSSRDAIFVINPQGQYLDANPSALSMVGYTLEELRTLKVPDLVHEESKPISYDRNELWKNGGTVETSLRNQAGDAIPVEMAISPLRLEDKVPSIIGIARDITERKELENLRLRQQEELELLVAKRTAELNMRVDEVEELNRVMGQMVLDVQKANDSLELAQKRLQTSNDELEAFSYSVSHDLRAPLRHIDGFLNLLMEREETKLDDTSMHYLKNVLDSTQRMGELINNLLQLSRTTRAKIQLTPVDTTAVVSSVIKELQNSLDGRNITFEVEDLPKVIGDQALLRVVWVNLLNNAVKFTKNVEDTHIKITAKPAEKKKWVTFSVEDNGAGFNQEYANKLFQAFQRLHNDTEFKGTGIGLATVARIIHRHGGEVWAEGQEGQGATFYFTLNLS